MNMDPQRLWMVRLECALLNLDSGVWTHEQFKARMVELKEQVEGVAGWAYVVC